jgi:O-antigen/teichoic acid export membrane protein
MAVDIQQLKHKTITGMFWDFGQKLFSQGVGFVVSMILARLLMPADFGLIAMTSIFLAVANIFADSGLGTSLVQKEGVDHLDYNTVFFTGLALSGFLYVILFFSAPLVGDLYHNATIVPVLRVMGLGLFLSSLNSVQSASVFRKLDYKKFFKVTLVGIVVSALVGVGMAYYGFGVWALVISGLVTNLVNAFTLNTIIKWRPRLEFSYCRLKGLWSFGANLMATNLLGTFFDQLRGFLIGVKYKPILHFIIEAILFLKCFPVIYKEH